MLTSAAGVLVGEQLRLPSLDDGQMEIGSAEKLILDPCAVAEIHHAGEFRRCGAEGGLGEKTGGGFRCGFPPVESARLSVAVVAEPSVYPVPDSRVRVTVSAGSASASASGVMVTAISSAPKGMVASGGGRGIVAPLVAVPPKENETFTASRLPMRRMTKRPGSGQSSDMAGSAAATVRVLVARDQRGAEAVFVGVRVERAESLAVHAGRIEAGAEFLPIGESVEIRIHIGRTHTDEKRLSGHAFDAGGKEATIASLRGCAASSRRDCRWFPVGRFSRARRARRR